MASQKLVRMIGIIVLKLSSDCSTDTSPILVQRRKTVFDVQLNTLGHELKMKFYVTDNLHLVLSSGEKLGGKVGPV